MLRLHRDLCLSPVGPPCLKGGLHYQPHRVVCEIESDREPARD